MRTFVAIVVWACVAGCTSSTPEIFDVLSTSNQRVIGHCVSDPSSIETVAYNGRTSELAAAKASDSPIPGFRAVSVSRPDYQYVLFVPTVAPNPPYHVACPLDGTRNCILAGTYGGGSYEAYVDLSNPTLVGAAAMAAVEACEARRAN